MSRFDSGRFSLRKSRPQSSSSFHEYVPERRVPLKERLKTQEEEMTVVSPEPGKDSLRSRFMRRFGLGNDERMTDIKETDEGKTRKKSDDFFTWKRKDDEVETESEDEESDDESENESDEEDNKNIEKERKAKQDEWAQYELRKKEEEKRREEERIKEEEKRKEDKLKEEERKKENERLKEENKRKEEERKKEEEKRKEERLREEEKRKEEERLEEEEESREWERIREEDEKRREMQQKKLEAAEEEQKESEIVIRREWKASRGGMGEEISEPKKKLEQTSKTHKPLVREDKIIPFIVRPPKNFVEDVFAPLLRKQVVEEEIRKVEAIQPSVYSTVVQFRRLERETKLVTSEESASKPPSLQAFTLPSLTTYQKILQGDTKVVVNASSLQSVNAEEVKKLTHVDRTPAVRQNHSVKDAVFEAMDVANNALYEGLQNLTNIVRRSVDDLQTKLLKENEEMVDDVFVTESITKDVTSEDQVELQRPSWNVGGIRTAHSHEVLSLEEIRKRLNELGANNSASSDLSSFNNQMTDEEKPKIVIKSLDDIKNRLNEIRARKRQVKMGELSSHKWVSMDEGLSTVDSSTLTTSQSQQFNGIGTTNSLPRLRIASLPVMEEQPTDEQKQIQ